MHAWHPKSFVLLARRPEDFGLNDTLALCQAQGIAVFGVCLGLQGVVDYCGGELGVTTLPWSAVQFHPESILSLEHECGRLLVANVVQCALAPLQQPPQKQTPQKLSRQNQGRTP